MPVLSSLSGHEVNGIAQAAVGHAAALRTRTETRWLFAKLKALLRARAVRTIDALWRAIGEICDLFSPQECKNYFDAAGYGFT
jgi:hypothetical protein